MTTTNANTNTTVHLTPKQWGQMICLYEEAKLECETTPWEDEVEHGSAREKLGQARQCLIDAMESAPWGQNGSMFVTDRSADWDGSREKSLSLNGRIRVKLLYSRGYPRFTRVEVFSAEEAEKKFVEAKASRRESQSVYDREREYLVKALVKKARGQGFLVELPEFENVSFWRTPPSHQVFKVGKWSYYDGQKGGVFRYETEEKVVYVGAVGAIRAHKSELPDLPEFVARAKAEARREGLALEWDLDLYGARF